jgi:hypothetical protein
LLLQLIEDAKNKRSSSSLKSDNKTTAAEHVRATYKIVNYTYFSFVEDIPFCYTIEIHKFVLFKHKNILLFNLLLRSFRR